MNMQNANHEPQKKKPKHAESLIFKDRLVYTG